MVEWNRDTQWRQGLLLTREACEAFNLVHPAGHEHTVVVVATHDCDLTQDSSKEPKVEVLVGCKIDTLDGICTNAKDSRKLHIEFSGEVSLLVEFDASRKFGISKEMLFKFSPLEDIRLTPERFDVYQHWLASRYRRSAFPDEFERRLKRETRLAEKITKALTPHGENIMGIFFDVDEGKDLKKEGADDTYTLDVYILHSSEPDFAAAKSAAQKAADAITDAFKKKLYTPTQTWRFIELRDCIVLSESTLTYQHFKQLKRWRLEHISFASDPHQPMITE